MVKRVKGKICFHCKKFLRANYGNRPAVWSTIIQCLSVWISDTIAELVKNGIREYIFKFCISSEDIKMISLTMFLRVFHWWWKLSFRKIWSRLNMVIIFFSIGSFIYNKTEAEMCYEWIQWNQLAAHRRFVSFRTPPFTLNWSCFPLWSCGASNLWGFFLGYTFFLT